MRACLLSLTLLLGVIVVPAFYRPPPHSAAPSALIGTVTGPTGPVAGAVVRFQATGTCTRTDAAGRFRLPLSRPARRVTASRDGFFIAGAPFRGSPLDLRLTPLPTDDNERYDWAEPLTDPAKPMSCGNCHAAIVREWAGTGHARSAAGPHFRGLYAGTDWHGDPDQSWGLLRDRPFSGDVCASCHAPGRPDNDPAEDDPRLSRGTHCDVCHKVAGVGDLQGGRTHGSFALRFLRPQGPGQQIFFGPLDDVDRGEDAFSPLYRDSRYCAACHEGVVLGTHVYSTYSEWLASPAARQGRQCQSCHMTPTGTLSNVAPGHGGKERDPLTLGNHTFFDGGHDAMLRRCLRVSATFAAAGGGTRAVVRVSADGAGHRVPTGFIDRHLVLVVEGLAADGSEVPLRDGPRLPQPAADHAGRPGRLYAKLLTDLDGHSPAPFWRPARRLDDTRLTPGQADTSAFLFGPGLDRVRVRLIYRRFWPEVVRAKGWPDADLVVIDETFRARP
jgi:hypothetical protein